MFLLGYGSFCIPGRFHRGDFGSNPARTGTGQQNRNKHKQGGHKENQRGCADGRNPGAKTGLCDYDRRQSCTHTISRQQSHRNTH